MIEAKKAALATNNAYGMAFPSLFSLVSPCRSEKMQVSCHFLIVILF